MKNTACNIVTCGVGEPLKDQTEFSVGTSGRRSSRIQKSLIVVQVALSIVLLVGAGSLTASLRNLGTAVAIACARTVRTLLYGINPIDPLTLIIAIVGLLTIALAASLLPAIRAASVDPIQALREE
jgi:ABC-type antimicrobial peptide transport system permease subunit